MNPLTNVKNLQKLNERELELGIIGKKSWHDEYKDSAWVFIGGLPYDLTEGDVICVFSQYGEVVNLNLIRDHKTGKTKGYGFLCYEDQRSTVLSVDNLNGIKLLGRTIRVDHVKDYKVPKDFGDEDELTIKMRDEGCAPQVAPSSESEEGGEATRGDNVRKKVKKEKKSKKQKTRKKKRESSSSSSSEEDSKTEVVRSVEVKQEKFDRGYERAVNSYSHPAGRQGDRRDGREGIEGSSSRYDGRDRVQRDESRNRHSDYGSGRERDGIDRRLEGGFNRGRYNGSYEEEEFSKKGGSGSSRRDRSRENGDYRRGNRDKEWQRENGRGRGNQEERERGSDRGRDLGERGRYNDVGRDRDQNRDRHRREDR